MRRALIRLTNDSFGEEVIRVTEACHCQQRGARARTRASAEHIRAGSTNITAADDVVTDHEPATGERDIEPAADDNATRWWSERHRSERCRGRRFDDTDYVGHASRSRNERNCNWYERTNVRRSRIDRAGSQRFEQAASQRTL